jgi:tRNA G26 N,N-dimethylase Trm1
MKPLPETLSIALELPKDFVNRVKAVKPPWLADLSDEQFIGHVITHGNFDEYLGQIQRANQQVQTLTSELHLKKGGDTPPESGGKRRKIAATTPLENAPSPNP